MGTREEPVKVKLVEAREGMLSGIVPKEAMGWGKVQLAVSTPFSFLPHLALPCVEQL